MTERSTMPPRQSKSTHFLFRLHNGFLQMVFSHFSRLVGDNWGRGCSAKHFLPTKTVPGPIEGGLLALYCAKMESRDRVALLAPPPLLYIQPLFPGSLYTHGFKQMEGWIYSSRATFIQSTPRIPRIIEHTHQGDKDKGIMENRYGWCWFSLGYSTHALLRESDKDK